VPINPNALSHEADEPADQKDQRELELAQADAEKDRQDAEQGKTRTRRTKAQMIADAVIPADDEQVDLKDAGTGAKIQRPWLVALEMVRDGKAEFADKAMKYSMLKWDQQKAAPAFEEPQVGPHDNQEEQVPVSTEQQITQLLVVPPDAEVGDEVSIGSDTFRVGHNRELISGDRPISVNGELVKPQRRWIRELGAGPNGPWESVDPIGGSPSTRVIPAKVESNGHSETPVQVETQRMPRTQEFQDDGTIKITTGILEKIGMPQVEQFASASQMQVGPISMSRSVVDDGRRTTVKLSDGREAEVITAAIEGFELLDNTVEFVAARFRGQLISFLAATGAIRQSVSA